MQRLHHMFCGKKDSKGNWNYIFKLLRNGNLYATDVNLTGTINATSGTIGGFIIGDPYMITTGKSDFGIAECLYFNPKGSASARAIGGVSTAISGWTITSGNNFGVTKNGNLYAKNARIDGTIIASEGSIGGWTINEYGIVSTKSNYTVALYNFSGTEDDLRVMFCGKKDSNNNWEYTFKLLRNGNLYATDVNLKGTINATGGKIGGFEISDKYMITSGYSKIGVSGCLYFNPAGSSSTASIAGSDTISGWLIGAGTNFGVLKDGTMYCKSGFINDALINNSVLDQAYCSNLYINNDIRLYRGGSNGYAIVLQYQTDAVKFGIDTSTLRLYGSSIYLRNTTTAVTSDQRLKINISEMGDKQETLFNLLIPRTFEYIGGTSGRTHFGFVAQELLTAIESSGLTTQDVAAYVQMPSENDDLGEYEYAIRYGEFVSLNTYNDKQLKKLYNDAMNRKDFSFDLNGNAFYNQYKDKFTKQGQLAMADTVGQVAAASGGYGNSYAQTAGQQVYQNNLDQLNDIVPDLYNLAFQQYQYEGQQLQDKYAMATGERDFAYGKYRDDVGDWQYNNDTAYNIYADTRDYEYQQSRDKVADSQWAQEFGYQKQRDKIADSQWQKTYPLR